MVHFAKSSDLKLTCVLSLGALNEINWNITENTPGSHWEHNRSSPRIQRGSGIKDFEFLETPQMAIASF